VRVFNIGLAPSSPDENYPYSNHTSNGFPKSGPADPAVGWRLLNKQAREIIAEMKEVWGA